MILDNILLLRFLGFKISNVPLCNSLERVHWEKQSAARSEIIFHAPVASGGQDIGGAKGLTYISSNWGLLWPGYAFSYERELIKFT